MNVLNKITFLYTNIGRGHPFYLDGIMEALVRKGNIKLVRYKSDVFKLSKGISLIGWKTIRWLYETGSSENLLGKMYSRIRKGTDYNQHSFLLNILSKNIRQHYMESQEPLVVAHPLLVAVLKGKKNIIYQHGEVVTPDEAVVEGAEIIFVPTKEAATPYYKIGYSKDKVIITGLCIEPALVKQSKDAFYARLNRINNKEPLTGAFFSSGAEPKTHIEKLVIMAKEAVSGGGRVLIFVHQNKMFMKHAIECFKQNNFEYSVINTEDYIPVELPPILIVAYNTRREENIFTARLFNHFDYFVAPSHERTNWALGLGLPMFIAGPAFGPFSPLNQKNLLDAKVARLINTSGEATAFNEVLSRLLRNGELTNMAQAGWGKYEINGFEKIADFLLTI